MTRFIIVALSLFFMSSLAIIATLCSTVFLYGFFKNMTESIKSKDYTTAFLSACAMIILIAITCFCIVISSHCWFVVFPTT